MLLIEDVRGEQEQVLRGDHLGTRLVHHVEAERGARQLGQLGLNSVYPVVVRCLFLEESDEDGARGEARERVARFDGLWGKVPLVPTMVLLLLLRGVVLLRRRRPLLLLCFLKRRFHILIYWK